MDIGQSLEDRFLYFMDNHELVENLDDLACFQEEKADYLFSDRDLIIEVKNIESDPSFKLEELNENLKNEPDYPLFFGEKNLTDVFEHFENSDELSQIAYKKLTMQVERALEKAEKQIKNTRKKFGLDSAYGVVIILNDLVKVLDPDHIASRAAKFLLKTNNGRYRYKNINSIVLISETHKVKNSGPYEEALPIVFINSPHTQANSLHNLKLDDLLKQWSHFCGRQYIEIERKISQADNYFNERGSNATERPMVRQELWRAQYITNRYYKKLSDDDFLKAVAVVMDELMPHFLKNKPNLSENKLMELMQASTHCVEEAQIRNMDMRHFDKYWNKELFN